MQKRFLSRFVGVALASLIGSASLANAAGPASSPEGILEQKAAAFQEALLDRHLSKEGIVLYRVDLATVRSDLENGTYPNLADAPTFTGQLAAAACTRATQREDPAAELALAERALDGLAVLMHVTGKPGLFARSLRRDAGRDIEELRGEWHAATAPFENFIFRSDASADQYANGILPAIAECSGLFPQRTRDMITAIADHLSSNEMHLIDVDGKRTRYGDLSPSSSFGFNSIFKLTGYAVFVLAARLDANPRWVRQRNNLRDVAKIPNKSKRTNLRFLGITNSSNDLMAWNLYRVLVPIARADADPALEELLDGMRRAWKRVASDRTAYFDAAYCSLEPDRCTKELLARAHDQLARFPLDKTLRGSAPELEDWPRRWIPGRKFRRLSREVVPIELRAPSSFEWKSSPYRLKRAPFPGYEYTGVDYLAAHALLIRAQNLQD